MTEKPPRNGFRGGFSVSATGFPLRGRSFLCCCTAAGNSGVCAAVYVTIMYQIIVFCKEVTDGTDDNDRLKQWDAGDRIMMEDFNADNAKVDAALAEQRDELVAINQSTGVTTSTKTLLP